MTEIPPNHYLTTEALTALTPLTSQGFKISFEAKRTNIFYFSKSGLALEFSMDPTHGDWFLTAGPRLAETDTDVWEVLGFLNIEPDQPANKPVYDSPNYYFDWFNYCGAILSPRIVAELEKFFAPTKIAENLRALQKAQTDRREKPVESMLKIQEREFLRKLDEKK